MRVDRLRLSGYRNISLLDLSLSGGVTLLVGDNAQGKTNLLEAVLVMTLGRSHRTQKERDLVQQGCDQAVIRVDIARRDGAHALRMVIPAQGPRSLRIDGAQARSVGEMMGRLNAVLFSPEDLRVVKDGPDVRRRFLNREISQLKPAYFGVLQRYARALRQRQVALRDAALHGTLDAWDEQLALEGCAMIRLRHAVLSELATRCAAWHDRLCEGSETLAIEYRPSIQAETPSEYMSRLTTRRMQDIAQKQTALGPHRDDVAMLIDGRDARLFASQGQQRTAALALRLAEVELIHEMTGEAPVLMLDDVFSELDARRRALLLGSIDGAQTLITCTDLHEALRAGDADGLRQARVLRVARGEFTYDG